MQVVSFLPTDIPSPHDSYFVSHVPKPRSFRPKVLCIQAFSIFRSHSPVPNASTECHPRRSNVLIALILGGLPSPPR